MVYMIPNQDFEEDEIDLWQLFLPLIKYKLQILLFLIIGLVIGLGYPWYKKQQIAQISDKDQIKTTLERLNLELNEGKQKLLSFVDQTPANGSQLHIAGAEYQYTTRENPGEVRIIKLDTFREPKITSNADPTNSPDLILTVESLPTTEIIKKLKNAYSQLFYLDQEILAANLKNKIEQRKIYIEENSREALPRSSVSREVDSRPEQTEKLRLKQTTLQIQIQNLHKELSYPVYFELKYKKVPWSIWKGLKTQLKEEEEEEAKHQKAISMQAAVLKKLVAKIEKYQVMDYLLTNNIHLPAEAFQGSSIKALQDYQ